MVNRDGTAVEPMLFVLYHCCNVNWLFPSVMIGLYLYSIRDQRGPLFCQGFYPSKPPFFPVFQIRIRVLLCFPWVQTRAKHWEMPVKTSSVVACSNWIVFGPCRGRSHFLRVGAVFDLVYHRSCMRPSTAYCFTSVRTNPKRLLDLITRQFSWGITISLRYFVHPRQF